MGINLLASIISLSNFIIGVAFIATGISFDVVLKPMFPSLDIYQLGIFYIVSCVLGFMVFNKQKHHLHPAFITINTVCLVMSTFWFAYVVWNYVDITTNDAYLTHRPYQERDIAFIIESTLGIISSFLSLICLRKKRSEVMIEEEFEAQPIQNEVDNES